MDSEIEDAIAFDLHLNTVGPLFLDVTKDISDSFDWLVEIASHRSFDAFLIFLSDDRKKEIVNIFRQKTESNQLVDSDIVFISKLIYSYSSKTLFDSHELIGYYDFVIRCSREKLEKKGQDQLASGKTIQDLITNVLEFFIDTSLGGKGLEGDPVYIKHFFESEKEWTREQLLEFWKNCHIDLSLPEISEALKKEWKR